LYSSGLAESDATLEPRPAMPPRFPIDEPVDASWLSR